MIAALEQLGFAIDQSDGDSTDETCAATRSLTIGGAGGQIPALEADLHIGNSGTTVRFLTAMLTLGRGAFRLDGIERMRQRPIGDLLDALQMLGATVRSEHATGCPPVWIHANGLPGGEARVGGAISSQFLSGILMAAPCAQRPVALVIDGPLVSKPYVEITRQVMRSFGADVEIDTGWERFEVAPTGYQPCDYSIEPDAGCQLFLGGGGYHGR